MHDPNSFVIRTSSPIVTTIPGESIVVPLTIVNSYKEWRSIQLSVAGDWSCAGIVASVSPSEIYPPGGAALMHVVVSSTTPPDSYSYKIIGKTGNKSETIIGPKLTVIVQSHEQPL